jgi:hypothetical protein
VIKQIKSPLVNNLPHCLYLNVDSKFKRGSELRLIVTAHFNEHVIDDVEWLGTVGVSLKGGDLLLKLDEIEFLRHTKYGRLSLSVSKRTTRSIGGTQRQSLEKNSKPSMSANLSSMPKLELVDAQERKSSASDEETKQFTDETSYESWQLNALGGPTPGWRFTLKTGESFLVGSLLSEEFCVCRLSGRRGRVEAAFVVDPWNVRMNVLSGLFTNKGVYDLAAPKKRKIFNLLLWKFVVRPRFQPHLSWVGISYE